MGEGKRVQRIDQTSHGQIEPGENMEVEQGHCVEGYSPLCFMGCSDP